MIEDSYEDKIEYIKQNISLDPYMDGADLLKCVSLLCLITQANRAKNPDFSVVNALEIITKDYPGNKVYEYFKERLPLICEPFLQSPTAVKFDSFGFKGKDEIVVEVKRLLDEWIPF